MLNPQSPMPLYRQLADILLDEIRSGTYAPGSRIPSEHKLAAAYGIGRPTARQAVDVLVRKRILSRKRGAGTFVMAPDQEIDLFSLAGTLSAFHKKGLAVSTRIRHKARIISVGVDDENPFSGQKAFFFSRLSRVAGTPVLIEDMYLDPTLFKGIDGIDLAQRSLSQIVSEKYYMRPVGGRQNFRLGWLNGIKARDLDVSPHTPILTVKRFLDFPQAQNAVYCELYCRTDQFVFSQEIGGTLHV